MPQKSPIEWTDYTSNPIAPIEGGWGCTKVSPGCANCYAETLNKRFGNKRAFTGDWEFELHDGEVHKLLGSRAISGKRVFVCDMMDLFHEDVPYHVIDRVFAVFALRRDVTWQVLTKRPSRLADYLQSRTPTSPGHVWPPEWLVCLNEIRDARGLNWTTAYSTRKHMGRRTGRRGTWPLHNVWLGTSAEDQQRFDERIDDLKRCPAAVHFVSAEPLLGPIDLGGRLDGIEWVIVGGESGPGARPCDVDAIGACVDRCTQGGVPVFVKQLGSHPATTDDVGFCEDWPDQTRVDPTSLPLPWQFEYLLRSRKGNDPAEWPEHLRVRQFPAANR